uniref:Transmembrane protein n=1 Tax=Rhipicephalus pulchellus TaxID=72859 RepID=L7LY42_RHIPC
MMPYLRSGVATFIRRVSLEPFGEDVEADDQPANSTEEPWDPGTGVAPPPPTTPPCDEAADDCSVDGEATDSASVTSETAETETRPPKTVPGTSWAAKRVRRLLAVQSAFGARFGATRTPSAPTFTDAQTQTLPDASTEEVHCRRCRGVYRRQRARDDDLSQPDAKPRPSVSVAATHKTDGATAGEYPEKPASWTSRALEPALVVASEILQYPWGADALILVGIVLLASFLVVLYYAVAVVLPIMVLAVILAMINSALFESSRFLHVLQRLGLT